MKKWNATQLKYLMAAVMVLDHIPHITGIVSPLWEGIFHALTRCVGVWFAYMAMEGFIHTRNLKNYLIRLWSWALIMFAGNSLLNTLFASKGNYLGIRELSLSYTLPQELSKKLYMQKLQFSITGQNLGYLTSARTVSPEISSGYPLPRTVILGVNVTF